MNRDALKTALSRFISVVTQLLEDTQEIEDRRIYTIYLTTAEAVLGKIGRDEPFSDDVDLMDKLFGSTWPKDEASYTKVYLEWDEFKKLLRRSINDMTVNERLFCLGLLDAFNNAVMQGSQIYLRKILYKCLLDEQNIQAIVEQQFGKNKST